MDLEVLKDCKIQGVARKKGDVCENVSESAAKIYIKHKLCAEVEADGKLKVSEVVELIGKVEKLEDLAEFEADKRKGVVKALEAKKLELAE